VTRATAGHETKEPAHNEVDGLQSSSKSPGNQPIDGIGNQPIDGSGWTRSRSCPCSSEDGSFISLMGP
jgi:hypothetical protein